MSEIDRRAFSAVLAAGVAGSWPARARAGDGGGSAGAPSPAPAGGLTDVPGLRVGHFTDPRRPTGCTVVVAEGGAVCGVDVRGGAPGTRETDLLDPVNTVQQVHAVLLSGGSAFGLDAATGVMRYLEEKGIGFPVGVGRVPIVPAAILFDLGIGDWTIRPDAKAGYEAARVAAGGPVPEGSVGAGAGATVGKVFGPGSAMKGGVGTASRPSPERGGGRRARRGERVRRRRGPGHRPAARRRAHAGRQGAARLDGRAARRRPAGPLPRGAEHLDRRRGHERDPHEDGGDEGRADGARRLRALDPPRSHALGRRRPVRPVDGRRDDRRSRPFSSGSWPRRRWRGRSSGPSSPPPGFPASRPPTDLARG